MEAGILARRIKILVFDVDGVFTAGQIFIGASGELMKAFHVQDGLGITLLHKAGLKTAVITGRESEIVLRRAAELAIYDVYQAVKDKVRTLDEILQKHSLSYEEACFVGDDLNDLAVMRKVGLACAVPNAAAEVKEAAHYIAGREGGNGAIRDVVEFVLKKQGKWEAIIQSYSRPGSMDAKQ